MNGPKYNFCVTAMPRCGLGWISSFLSYGASVICYSESITRAIGVKSKLPELTEGRISGDGDPMSPSWIGEIEKVIVVNRAMHAIRASIANSGMDRKLYDYGASSMATLIESGRVTHEVDYDKLFTGSRRDEEAERLWVHVAGDLPFDGEHFRRCCDLHVNPRAIK